MVEAAEHNIKLMIAWDKIESKAERWKLDAGSFFVKNSTRGPDHQTKSFAILSKNILI
jgi:hypothetical protein